jgi:hypothetical protein
MSTILEFKARENGGRRRPPTGGEPEGEIVIFPGVRMERHALDLGYRLRDAAGRGEFHGLGAGRLPRKTS